MTRPRRPGRIVAGVRGGRTAVRAAAAIALFAAILGASPAAGHPNARFYKGDVTVSTEWSGVIRLTGTVVIRAGATVTVEPGTRVLVQPGKDVDVVVEGRLLVRGVPAKPVRFETAGGCTAGPWGGIVFRDGSTGVFEHAAVRCSTKGITGSLAGVTRTGISVEAAP